MRDFLAINYDIHVYEETVINGAEGFIDDNYVYFIISGDMKEMIHMEQASLAYYLYENNWNQVIVPVQNKQGGWFTKHNDSGYMVLKADRSNADNRTGYGYGERLARFHMDGSLYSYEPQLISSYGQWKDLWIGKMSAFEQKIEQEAYDNPGDYYRELVDFLPYLVGISENAIQYMQESEHESRFHETDQGTIAFRRYYGQLNNRYLWMTDLVYDHPARDLAAYIRHQLLKTEDPMHDIRTFLDDYQHVKPLSVFSWRLLYARLLFPVHFFDTIERGFIGETYEYNHAVLLDLMERQPVYERRLRMFFDNAGVSTKELAIPVLHWL
ncbi:hypothetical protein FFL34_03390 [Lentibacillus cibarius]|uniref:Spore coat protein YutH n=1 Tax=Lentibacillus cibarius TaxID=2583219 RepID=A0A5S3QRA5_9BACI|nr:hypothetical protein FFL34_03390 [Lentibacillus cibarius]